MVILYDNQPQRVCLIPLRTRWAGSVLHIRWDLMLTAIDVKAIE